MARYKRIGTAGIYKKQSNPWPAIIVVGLVVLAALSSEGQAAPLPAPTTTQTSS